MAQVYKELSPEGLSRARRCRLLDCHAASMAHESSGYLPCLPAYCLSLTYVVSQCSCANQFWSRTSGGRRNFNCPQLHVRVVSAAVSLVGLCEFFASFWRNSSENCYVSCKGKFGYVRGMRESEVMAMRYEAIAELLRHT